MGNVSGQETLLIISENASAIFVPTLNPEEPKMKRFLKIAFAALLALSLVPMAAQATIVKFSLDYEFSGATQPAGSTLPWLTATFDDENTPGTVLLTMYASGLVADEYINDWLFNFDTTNFEIGLLSFSRESGTAPSRINLRDEVGKLHMV